MLSVCRVALVGCLPLFIQPVFAKDTIDSEQNSGIAFSIKTQQQDYDLTSLNFASAPPQLASLANRKEEFQVNGETQTASLQLNHRIVPGINVFGSVGKVQGETIVKIPALPTIQLPDVSIKTDGMTYTLGANAIIRKDRHFAAISYARTLYKPDNTRTPPNYTYSITPSVGVITDAGTFILGVMYQENKRSYLGDITTPLGQVTADAGIENQHKTSGLLEYRTELGKDLYLRSGVEVGGRQGLHLAISKRF